MSKKNRRKTLKSANDTKKNTFSMDESKTFVIVTIVMFHILPLFFVMMGENGQALLVQFFLLQLNPLFLALAGLIYGIKKGFNAKFPLIMGVIATISIPMYYNLEAQYMVQTIIIEAIVYLIFSYAAVAAGSFVKRLLNL